MWIEYYEDYYAENPDAMLEDVGVGDDVQFVTGEDAEFDELERRIADGSITDEEIERTLARWEGKTPEQKSVSLGDGFSDDYRSGRGEKS